MLFHLFTLGKHHLKAHADIGKKRKVTCFTALSPKSEGKKKKRTGKGWLLCLVCELFQRVGAHPSTLTAVQGQSRLAGPTTVFLGSHTGTVCSAPRLTCAGMLSPALPCGCPHSSRMPARDADTFFRAVSLPVLPLPGPLMY